MTNNIDLLHNNIEPHKYLGVSTSSDQRNSLEYLPSKPNWLSRLLGWFKGNHPASNLNVVIKTTTKIAKQSLQNPQLDKEQATTLQNNLLFLHSKAKKHNGSLFIRLISIFFKRFLCPEKRISKLQDQINTLEEFKNKSQAKPEKPETIPVEIHPTKEPAQDESSLVKEPNQDTTPPVKENLPDETSPIAENDASKTQEQVDQKPEPEDEPETPKTTNIPVEDKLPEPSLPSKSESHTLDPIATLTKLSTWPKFEIMGHSLPSYPLPSSEHENIFQKSNKQPYLQLVSPSNPYKAPKGPYKKFKPYIKLSSTQEKEEPKASTGLTLPPPQINNDHLYISFNDAFKKAIDPEFLKEWCKVTFPLCHNLSLDSKMLLPQPPADKPMLTAPALESDPVENLSKVSLKEVIKSFAPSLDLKTLLQPAKMSIFLGDSHQADTIAKVKFANYMDQAHWQLWEKIYGYSQHLNLKSVSDSQKHSKFAVPKGRIGDKIKIIKIGEYSAAHSTLIPDILCSSLKKEPTNQINTFPLCHNPSLKDKMLVPKPPEDKPMFIPPSSGFDPGGHTVNLLDLKSDYKQPPKNEILAGIIQLAFVMIKDIQTKSSISSDCKDVIKTLILAHIDSFTDHEWQSIKLFLLFITKKIEGNSDLIQMMAQVEEYRINVKIKKLWEKIQQQYSEEQASHKKIISSFLEIPTEPLTDLPASIHVLAQFSHGNEKVLVPTAPLINTLNDISASWPCKDSIDIVGGSIPTFLSSDWMEKNISDLFNEPDNKAQKKSNTPTIEEVD